MTSLPLVSALVSLVTLGVIIWVGVSFKTLLRKQDELPEMLKQVLVHQQLDTIKSLYDGMTSMSGQLSETIADSSERLRGTVSQDLKQTRDAMLVLQLSQTEELSTNREAMTQRLLSLTADLQTKFDEFRAQLQAKHDELRLELHAK